MSRFGPDPRSFFDGVYLDTPPWDVGGAQPALAALFADIPPEGPVLRPAEFLSRVARVPAVCACIERLPAAGS